MSITITVIVSVLWSTIVFHFGSKWIDKMLSVQPPIDPSKPIVRQPGDKP